MSTAPTTDPTPASPSSTSTSPSPTLPPDPGVYRVVRQGDEVALKGYVERCIAARLVGVDTETTNVADWNKDVVGEDRLVGSITVGYCLSAQYGQAIYIPFGHGDDLAGLIPGQLDFDVVRELVRPLFVAARRGEVALVFHNAGFDYKMLRKDGLVGPAHASAFHCTATMAKVVSWGTGRWDPRTPDHGQGSPRGLKNLTRELCRHDVIEIKDLFGQPEPATNGKKKVEVRIDFDSLNPFDKRVYSYAAADASNCLGVLKPLRALLKQFDLAQVYDLIEQPLMIPVAEMRQVGVCLDDELCVSKHTEGLRAAAELRSFYLGEMSKTLLRTVDETNLNLDSPPQLSKFFFSDPPDGLGLPVLERSKKTGKPSVNKYVLRTLAQNFPVVRALITYRGLTKQLSAFLAALPGHTLKHTGRIHADFNPLSTATGRFSCSEPNLQQLPREGMQFDLGGGREYVANVRDVIVAAPEHYLMDCDYSQIEYRALAGEAQETSLLNGWRDDPTMDVHHKTAQLFLRKPADQITDLERQGGKTLNFSQVYGQGTPALADKLGVSIDEARQMREDYFKALPAIQGWTERVRTNALRDGYSVTPFGRRRYISELRSPEPGTREAGLREAVNHVIQGGCADLLKLALVRLHRAIWAARLDDVVRIVMTIHDSLVVEAHYTVPVARVYQLMRDAMVIAIPKWPPIVIDCKVGYRYGSLAKFSPDEPFEFPARTLSTVPPPPEDNDGDDGLDVESSEDGNGDVEPVSRSSGGVAGGASAGSTHTPTPPAQVLYMPIPQITRPRQDALKTLLMANPGPHRVVVSIAGHPPRALGRTTSLTPDDPRLREQVGPYAYRWVGEQEGII